MISVLFLTVWCWCLSWSGHNTATHRWIELVKEQTTKCLSYGVMFLCYYCLVRLVLHSIYTGKQHKTRKAHTLLLTNHTVTLSLYDLILYAPIPLLLSFLSLLHFVCACVFLCSCCCMFLANEYCILNGGKKLSTRTAMVSLCPVNTFHKIIIN